MPVKSALILMLTLVTACATSPMGRQQLLLVPENQMQEMGIAAFQDIKRNKPVVNQGEVREYVNCVAGAITRQLPGTLLNPWEVVVFEDDTANAFALPGGKIGVHAGLLDITENQDQLGAVIAHEIAHVLARHGAERVSQQFAAQAGMDLTAAITGTESQTKQQLLGMLGLGAQYGILLPYSRVQESEADVYGLELMAKAGFDPRASIALWQNMKAATGPTPPEFLSTHPAPETRIRNLNNRIPEVLPVYENTVREGFKPRCS